MSRLEEQLPTKRDRMRLRGKTKTQRERQREREREREEVWAWSERALYLNLSLLHRLLPYLLVVRTDLGGGR